jgi:HSP20 family protein
LIKATGEVLLDTMSNISKINPKKSKDTEIVPRDDSFERMYNDIRRSFFNELMWPWWSQAGSPTSLALPRLGMHPSATAPSVDLVDYHDKFVVTADLPGFNKEDVKVSVTSHAIEIDAETKLDKEEKHKKYIQKERSFEKYERALSLPEEINPSKVSASMKNGVLELILPKLTPTKEIKKERIAIK